MTALKLAQTMTEQQNSLLDLDLEHINASLRDASPADVVRWALALDRETIATTSFGRNAALMLHLVSEEDK